MSSELTGRAWELHDVEATHALAARVAAVRRGGDVIALRGELGAGKTEFVRGLAAALGAGQADVVCSPSYLLLNVYAEGSVPLAHFDAYFMSSSDDLERAGFDELRRAGHLVAIEWAERVEDALPDDTLWVDLRPLGDTPDGRRAELSQGARWSAAVQPERADDRHGEGRA